MDLGSLFKSPDAKGFRDTPIFFFAFGGAITGYVMYTIAVGRIAVDKAGRTILTRAENPGLFWLSVVLLGVLGAGMLLQAWRQYRRNTDA